MVFRILSVLQCSHSKKYAPFEYKEEVLKICNVDIFALNKNLAQRGAF